MMRKEFADITTLSLILSSYFMLYFWQMNTRKDECYQ